jgi:excisionase family DNA binding protein
MEKQDKLLLRGQEVAEALNISRALAYRWMAAGILPVVRVPGGRSIRVPQQALLKWIETNTAGAGEREQTSKPTAPKRRPL